MKKGFARKLLIIALAALLLPAAACDSQDGYDVDIDVPGRTQSPDGTNGQTDSRRKRFRHGQPGCDGDADSVVEQRRSSNTIDPNELDGTDIVDEEEKLSYAEYRAINSDVVGWIKIGNTNVDYPVVKSRDNIDYLTQNAKKEASKAGAIFMDYRCGVNDSHVIIYGHNMSKSKIMFAQMTNYANRSFYDANRTFELTFGDKTYTYRVFSVYSVDVSDADYMAVDEAYRATRPSSTI